MQILMATWKIIAWIIFGVFDIIALSIAIFEWSKKRKNKKEVKEDGRENQ